MRFAFGTAILGVFGAVAFAGPVDGEAGIAARIAGQRCAGCHGDATRTAVRPGIPNLAGQNAEAISKQLRDFSGGARSHAQMTAIARGLHPGEVALLAAYYASIPVSNRSPGRQHYGAVSGFEKLARFGDSSRQLPACIACHSSKNTSETPRLAGQSRDYLLAQLNAFASGQRTNDAAGRMRSIAAKLTPQERASLAEYFESQKSS